MREEPRGERWRQKGQNQARLPPGEAVLALNSCGTRGAGSPGRLKVNKRRHQRAEIDQLRLETASCTAVKTERKMERDLVSQDYGEAP